MVRSTTYDAGDPGSNPALGTQGIVTVWMLTPHYDAFLCSPGADANLRHQLEEALDCAKGQKAELPEAEFPFCPRSFDRAVMVAVWYDLQLTTLATRVRTLPWARRVS